MTETCAPTASIREYVIDWRKPGHYYRCYVIEAGDRRIELSISPTGRSIQVYVDGEKT